MSYYVPNPPFGDISLDTNERRIVWEALRDSLHWAKISKNKKRIDSIERALTVIEKIEEELDGWG